MDDVVSKALVSHTMLMTAANKVMDMTISVERANVIARLGEASVVALEVGVRAAKQRELNSPKEDDIPSSVKGVVKALS